MDVRDIRSIFEPKFAARGIQWVDHPTVRFEDLLGEDLDLNGELPDDSSYGDLRSEISTSEVVEGAAQSLGLNEVKGHSNGETVFRADPKVIKRDAFAADRRKRIKGIEEDAPFLIGDHSPTKLWQRFSSPPYLQGETVELVNRALSFCYGLHQQQFETPDGPQSIRNPYFSFFADIEQFRFFTLRAIVKAVADFSEIRGEVDDLGDRYHVEDFLNENDAKRNEYGEKLIQLLSANRTLKTARRIIGPLLELERENIAPEDLLGYHELMLFAASQSPATLLAIIFKDAILLGRITPSSLASALSIPPEMAEQVAKEVLIYNKRLPAPHTIPSSHKIGGTSTIKVIQWLKDPRQEEILLGTRYDASTRPEIFEYLIELATGIALATNSAVEVDFPSVKDIERALAKCKKDGDVQDLHRAAIIVESREDAVKALKAFFDDQCTITIRLRDMDFNATPGGYQGALHLVICMMTGTGGQYPIELKIIEKPFHIVQNNYAHALYGWSRSFPENDKDFETAGEHISAYEKRLFAMAAHNTGRIELPANQYLPAEKDSKGHYIFPDQRIVLALAAIDATETLLRHDTEYTPSERGAEDKTQGAPRPIEKIAAALGYLEHYKMPEQGAVQHNQEQMLNPNDYLDEWAPAIAFRNRAVAFILCSETENTSPAFRKLMAWRPGKPLNAPIAQPPSAATRTPAAVLTPSL